MPHNAPEATLQRKAQAVYRIQQFARLAGVTVRALRHYDRHGLLTPAARSEAGHRLYRDSDFARLERIVVLKFLGLPLVRIAETLNGRWSLGEILASQHLALGHTRGRLAVAIDAIERVERSLSRGTEPNWTRLSKIVREIGMQENPEASWKAYQLEDARKKIYERRLQWNATLQDYELVRDIRAAIGRGETPDSPGGRMLIARWRDAIERFVGGDPELRAAHELVMSDRANWPGPAESMEFRQYFERAIEHAS